jgi:hypothetical protein
MYPNKNSGLGLLMAQALFGQAVRENATTGRIFIVAKSGITNESEIKALYGNNYPDGTPVIYTTIALAVVACLASRNDVILVAPGHTETISSATALQLNVAGVTIVGIGSGSLKPTLTLDTAATSKIPVSAANITVRGIKFVANFADIATVFLLTTAQGFTVDKCEFLDTSSILNFLAIITTTVAVVADNLTFTNNKVILQGTTAATTPIKVLGTHNRLVINDNYFNEAALSNTSAVLAHAALVVTNLEMARNRVFRPSTDTATGALLVTTSSTTNTGVIYDNYVFASDVAAALLVTAGSIYGMFNNLYIGDADASGYVLPAIGAN